MRIFKPFGWEVIDIRYGGVISRLDTASERLMDYVEGRLERIEELEQERLIYSVITSYSIHYTKLYDSLCIIIIHDALFL